MNPDSEILSQYLDQTQQLYGNHLFLEKKLKDELEAPYNNLDEFHRLICECQKCPLGKTRNNFVFGAGGLRLARIDPPRQISIDEPRLKFWD